MNNKITFNSIIKTIKSYLIFFLISIIAIPLTIHFAFEGLDSFNSKEQLNIAISCFAYHDDNLTLKDDMLKHMDNYNIKEVNFSYMSCETDSTSFSNLTDWVSTYGVYESDILITDFVVADSLVSTFAVFFTEDEINSINSSVNFTLKYQENEEGKFGVLIHDIEDEEYNNHFTYLNDWLLFKSDIEEFNFVLSANELSQGSRESNIEAIKYFLSYATKKN